MGDRCGDERRTGHELIIAPPRGGWIAFFHSARKATRPARPPCSATGSACRWAAIGGTRADRGVCQPAASVRASLWNSFPGTLDASEVELDCFSLGDTESSHQLADDPVVLFHFRLAPSTQYRIEVFERQKQLCLEIHQFPFSQGSGEKNCLHCRTASK